MTIPSIQKLKELEKTGVTCTSCGAKITEEKIDNLFKISPKGSRLVTGSYWMVGQVVDALHEQGVREEDIFVDITYNGEQIDILALFMSNVLIFELKDKEFGLGDAYKFHGKVSRLDEKSEQTVIPVAITTKTVAAEAKKLLSEVTTSRERFPWRGYREYLFIEGLNQVDYEIRKLLDKIIRRVVSGRMNIIAKRFPAITIREMKIA